MFSIAFSISASAQVQVTNLPTPPAIENSVMLQVDAADKGVSLPNVALAATDVETIISPKDGLLVYNTSTTTTNPATDVTPGFYYWYNNAWQPLGKITDSYIFQQKIDVSVLGYTPTPMTTALFTAENSGSSFSSGGATWNKRGCVKWTVSAGGNEHTYCTYRASSNRTWAQAFSFAQARGGYLVTITSDAERNWLKTNVIDPTTGKDLLNSIWLGYNKYQSRYIPAEGNNGDLLYERYRYKWITGEKWTVNWEVPAGATVQNNFATGQPSIINANGAAFIMRTADSASRQWDDRDGATSTDAKDVIVEFQDTY
ncbi:MAG: C-type lectin protein [Chryseobacterium sp.]|nr:C-type lectin protein [Chryseobacterium sp.]